MGEETIAIVNLKNLYDSQLDKDPSIKMGIEALEKQKKLEDMLHYMESGSFSLSKDVWISEFKKIMHGWETVFPWGESK